MIGALVTGTGLALVAMGVVLQPLFFGTDEPAAPSAAGPDGCTACGGRLLAGARFCAWCGAAVDAGADRPG
ncbi:MAG: hypothetical protein KGN74_11590 [Gemmatimonadota bacterium]|nr:hypothetical protein [Gemmatimonadota bacterium]MDE3173706.1 hypothetical protein [Gemmatimonadota bacterium]